MLTRQEVVVAYCERMGLVPKNWTFYEVYGLFRLAVIIQQIAYRHHHRQTLNPAFKRFWMLVHYLDWRVSMPGRCVGCRRIDRTMKSSSACTQ